MAYELFYKFQVTDNISITPALHYLSEPFSSNKSLDDVEALSGLVKTTFTF